MRLSAFAALALLAGCQGSGRVETYPVSGQVEYGGKPAAGVQVFLMPTSAPTRPEIPGNPHGVTDEQGRFRLSTFGDGDGAAAGGYQVVLVWPDPKSDAEEQPDLLMGWHDAVHSKLTARIKAGDNALPAFKLARVTQPPGQAEGVPGRN